MNAPKPTSRNPWAWIPSLYVAEGLPYALVISVSVVLYKNLGVSNAAIAFYTSWLYLPWVIKPLWSPMVDLLRTRRWWIWMMQLVIGAALASVALTIPAPHFIQLTLVFFWLLAFSSATHDIAADGFYMLATTEREQSSFSGIRNVFYRFGLILAQGELVSFVGILVGKNSPAFDHTSWWSKAYAFAIGLLVNLARKIHDPAGDYVSAWSMAFVLVAVIFLCFSIYHQFVLPQPAPDQPVAATTSKSFSAEFLITFETFFQKPEIVVLLLFLLLYRLGEAQLVKMVQPFLLDPRSLGGLGLTDEQPGLIYGKVGIGALICGGLLGGWVISRQGLKFWLWPMLLAIHLPDAVFIWLAYALPQNLTAVGAGVAVEQFGYGFGFTAFMLYMIRIARGEHRTAHYAICTGFMALGMMLPGMWSGWLQEHLGYRHFFVWVIFATIPSFLVALKIPLDAEFGKKN